MLLAYAASMKFPEADHHMITDVNTLPYLQMELAAVVDVGEHFVKATYNLEDVMRRLLKLGLPYKLPITLICLLLLDILLQQILPYSSSGWNMELTVLKAE